MNINWAENMIEWRLSLSRVKELRWQVIPENTTCSSDGRETSEFYGLVFWE